MTNANSQERKANDFLTLHCAPAPLILPNVWDVASTMVFEHEGFTAIGTTSAGIAAVLGYADGQKMSLADNLQMVKRISDNTSLPVSADIESGYASSIEGVAKTAQAVLNAGAVGLNIEDGTGDLRVPLFDTALQQEKIGAIREIGITNRIHLVINARVDTYLVNDDVETNLRDAIERGNSYREAGADCVFVPDVGNLDKHTIAILVKEIDAPINIIAGAATPSVPELQDLGVSRVSVGPRPMRAILSHLRKIAKELYTAGTYELMAESSISYAEVNGWFEK